MTKKHFTRMCREVHDLDEIGGLLEWDQSVMMPVNGARQRGRQQAALARLIHERWKSSELGDLLGRLQDGADDTDPWMKADLREVRRRRARALLVPDDLVAQRAMACSLAQGAWEKARKDNDFKAFLPYLEDVVRLTREWAACINGDRPYDALLDEYEPGALESELRPLFERVRERTLALLDRLKGASNPPSRAVMTRGFPMDSQRSFVRRLATDMGFDWSAGRLDTSAHPFTIGTLHDVRITTRYDPDNLATALFATMHEVGHALYEQGLDPERYSDPSGHACSLGIHESQSRFWENLIGRSRPFW
ncbi:MAG: carboxypeptidase M32, partial [Deltaproteobacteria bacterium]|nr:carboxypeptidase M32 [Deltaproteobacteria bacterium]